MAALLQGFLLGLSMILPIGAQNSLVLNQGILRSHHMAVALVCALCDAILITLGVFGASALIAQSDIAMNLITLLGVAFLSYYGAMSLKSAFAAQTGHDNKSAKPQARWKVISATLAVTLLNPHVYLDTVVVIGGVGSQFEAVQRQWFTLGCILASIVWFFTLASAAAKLSPWLSRPRVKQIIDVLVCVIMWLVALNLLHFWLAQR